MMRTNDGFRNKLDSQYAIFPIPVLESVNLTADFIEDVTSCLHMKFSESVGHIILLL